MARSAIRSRQIAISRYSRFLQNWALVLTWFLLANLNACAEPGATFQEPFFSGVGKRIDEINFALKLGIECFNVESASELARLSTQAKLLGCKAPVSLRVNPNVDAATHPYISTGLKENKFGVPIEEAMELFEAAAADPNLDVVGIDCHIGSQIAQIEPLLEAAEHLLALVDKLDAHGISIQHADLGGGFGVVYDNEPEFDITSYGQQLAKLTAGRDLQFMFEPGRFLVAGGGVLLTEVQYLKHNDEVDRKNFAVVDAAMNDLLRPALYQAKHEIVPITRVDQERQSVTATWDVVGPVCESADFLAQNRQATLAEEQLVAILNTGAYGMSLASNYNTRPRAAEVMIDEGRAHLIRRRESLSQLLELETFADSRSI